jgi:ferredoxin-type protein NapF
LASFNRLPVLAAGAAGGAAWIPGLLVPLMLVAALWQPAVWCSHVCPLGYLQELVDHRRGPVPARWRRERRRFLAGMAVGAVAGLGWRRAARAARPPVLPPGALPADRFGAVCTRCYACVNACPSGVLRVGWPRGGRDLAAWFQPELDADAGACEEFCRACTQVCPSGAIRPLSEESKRRRQLGVARVTRSACLAWADGEYCMVCQEFCPYHAIESVPDARGVPRPVVNPSVCRGCGFCQHACPAVRAGKAVRVEGLAQQRELRE